jgi:hypothetical protein
VPSVVFIISTIWERERQSKRVAIIYGCNCLSGAFGGLIAVSYRYSEFLVQSVDDDSMVLRVWARDMGLSLSDGYLLSKEPFQLSCVEYAGLCYPRMPRRRGS